MISDSTENIYWYFLFQILLFLFKQEQQLLLNLFLSLHCMSGVSKAILDRAGLSVELECSQIGTYWNWNWTCFTFIQFQPSHSWEHPSASEDRVQIYWNKPKQCILHDTWKSESVNVLISKPAAENISLRMNFKNCNVYKCSHCLY